jgi:hypothetical protein
MSLAGVPRDERTNILGNLDDAVAMIDRAGLVRAVETRGERYG